MNRTFKFKATWLTACLTVWLLSGFNATALIGQTAPQKPVLEGIRDRQVSLSWQSPEQIYGLFDDFEDHTDFALNSPGRVGWQYLDLDNDQVYAIGEYAYTNRGKPSAFQVWNPLQTIPVYNGPRGLPHSGNKCLISYATANDYRNDWLISPDLTDYAFTDSIRLSFWARAFNNSYGIERINIGYSTTDAASASFTFLNGSTPIEVPESNIEHPGMYYFEYVFPATTKYIAVNCVTNGGQAFMIDDITIATNLISPTAKAAHNYLLGYNLWRGATKANTSLITKNAYVDEAPAYGPTDYRVEAVYADGSTARSEALSVNIPDIHQLPFIERFDVSGSLSENFWTLDPAEDNYWSIDYREGGLVIYAATFKPRSSLRDYKDFCLVSKELDATNLSEVMLAFDIACNSFSGSNTREYIETQVWNGSTWQTVQTHTNENGSFDYTRCYVDLSSVVAGKKFRVRFNGGGGYAFNVNGWYISYIGVYEKRQATVSGTVRCGGVPVAGATVTWKNTEDDVYTTVSGSDGSYRLENVNAGDYTVTATLKSYNIFESETTVVKGSKAYDIAMTRPAVTIAAATASHTLKAEARFDGKLTLTNSGNGPVRVNLKTVYGQKPRTEPKLEPIAMFRPQDVRQSAVCFDGTYFYTALSDEYQADGTIWQYDREGNFIRTFVPSIHVRRYFDITTDGADFYTANNDSIIRRMDFSTGRIIEEIPTPVSNINHIAYDASRDAFYVGCLNSIALVGRDGRLIENEVTLSDALFAGSVYDPYFKEGPTMWIIDQNKTNNAANALTKAVIRRFDLNTKTVKNDYVFDCSTLPGFVYGGSETGQVWGESLFGTTRYKDGHFVLMGAIISDPGQIYILDLYDNMESWCQPETYRFDLAAGETKEIGYTLSAADLLDGDTRSADIRCMFDPALESLNHAVSLTVSGKADLAKPLDLRASSQDDKAAVLTWQAPQGAATPQSFRIYRNGELAGTAQAGATTYTDPNLKAGLYRYEVSAVYAGGESAKSHTAEVEIYVGIPCYAPKALRARNVRNETIALTWNDPSQVGDRAAVLRYDNGLTDDYLGLWDYDAGTGLTFTGAAYWSAADLEDYRSMRLESVSFVPMTASATYTVKIWEDNTLVREQAVGANYVLGEPNTVTLSQALTLSSGKSLRVGIEGLKGASLGVDNGPAADGKGNWVYSERFGGWMTLTAMGGSNANFNLAISLAPRTQAEANTAKSYNVYRNGVKINGEPVTATTYEDRPATGLYTYTVTAVHENCESFASNPAKAQIVDIKAHTAPDAPTARIAMNREIRLQWTYPDQDGSKAKSGDDYVPFAYVKDFDLNEMGETAVVTDGEYIYTSYWNRNDAFNKYDMQGNLIESFTIKGAGPIYDLTWDGLYFYGGGNDLKLVCLDFTNRTVVKTMNVTAPVRHCTYVPDLDNGKGGFEIGEWSTSYFVSMDGTYIAKGPTLSGAFGSAYHDGKLYFFQQRTGTACEIVEYDFATLTPTGHRADLGTYRQFRLNEGALAGGLGAYTGSNGSTMLMANIQNAPGANKVVLVEATPNTFITGFNLYRDGQKVNAEALSSREYTDVQSTAGSYTYTVSAIYIDGQESGQSAPLTVRIVEPTHCEAPVGLRAIVEDRDVRLQWTVPLEETVNKDGAEAYKHLAMGQIGACLTVDGDRLNTYTPTTWSFDGMGRPGSFLVLDQRLLSPARSDLAYAGNKFIAAFGVKSDILSVAYNRDWLIMPVSLTGTASGAGTAPQWISFMARGLETDGTEAFRVAYSINGTDTANFARVSQATTTVNCLWTRFVFDLPANAKYVAIEYLSGNGKALLIDDITIATGDCPFRPDESLASDEPFKEKVAGYSVYRDGQLLTPEPIEGNAYFDGNRPNGSYTYTVKALYNTSCESGQSAAVTAKVNYSAPMTAPTNLKGTVKNQNVALTWSAPLYAEDKMLSYAGTDLSTALGFADEAVYYAACRWEAHEMLGFYGYRLYGVTAYFAGEPTKLDLLIWQDGELAYEQDVTSQCKAMTVSGFLLNEPFVVDFSKSLMIGFRIEAAAETYSIAIDNGPLAAGKGDLYSEDGVNWSAASYVQGTEGNWFIAGLMELPMPATGPMNGFQGYLVYRDGEAAQKTLTQNLFFTDENLAIGTHTYAVAAVYGAGEKRSEPISVRVLSNEELSENDLRVAPNPATDRFHVTGAFDYLEVTDLQGRVRLRHEAAQGGQVSTAGLSAGVYMVRIHAAHGVTGCKLVIR